MPSIPYLLQDLTPEQRLRILALDYATSTGFVPPDEWLKVTNAVESYLSTGDINYGSASIHSFPTTTN